jgi:DNA-binding Lrp family transcriptional regulator
MKNLKPIDYKLLFELMKDSKRSDRQIAKFLHVSQPTITRRRAMLEKEALDGYTAIPRWEKLGYEVVVFTFVKHKIKYAKPEVRKEAFRRVEEWMMNQPNVVLAIDGQGMGWDGMCISFHKSYSDFTEFIRKHDSDLSDLLIESQSFVATINEKTIRKPFHLKYLAKEK